MLLLPTALLWATASAAPSSKGLWVWGGHSPLANASASDAFFAWSAKEAQSDTGPVDTIFVEDEGIAKGTAHSAAFEELVAAAAAAGIRVAALYGWNAAEGPFPAVSVLKFVDGVVALPSSSALAGISFDIEPRDHPDPTSYQQYADLLPKVRAKLDSANQLRAQLALPKLTLSIAGSWGYETANVSCGSLGPTLSLLDCAVTYVDTYILMNYRNNAYGCSCKPPINATTPGRNAPWMKCPSDGSPIAGNQTGCKNHYVAGKVAGHLGDGMIGKAASAAAAVKASSYKPSRLSLGVEVSCFPPSDAADGKYQYKLSFCGTSTRYLAAQMKATELALREIGLWDGVVSETIPWSIEDYHALVALEQSPVAAAAAVGHDVERTTVDVFVPGMTSTQGDKYQCIRIPSVVHDQHTGNLLAFAECRHTVGDGCLPHGVNSGPGGTDLCSRISTDQGATWGPLTTLAKNAGQPTATYMPAKMATLLEFNQKSGKGCLAGRGGSCCPVFQMITVNGGISWSKKALVVPTDVVAWPARVGPGIGIQLRSNNPYKPGRLLNIGWHFANGSYAYSFDSIYFSDDGANTWQQPKQPKQLDTPCDEAQVVELPNGSILAMMRPTITSFKDCPTCRQLSISTDGGESWGWGSVQGAVHPEPQLNGAICMGSILGDANATYASFPNSSDFSSGGKVGRKNGVIRVSTDNAKTWSDLFAFGAKTEFAYSCLTDVQDQSRLGILYETGVASCVGPSCRTVFTTIPR